MKRIGITGGIGSGKSYVAALAAEHFGLQHVNSDDIAREQMKRGGASYDAVISEFGTSILDTSGEIDRAKLAAIVFCDNDRLRKLNQLTHPYVTEYIEKMCREFEASDCRAVLIETAILKEAGYDKLCDEIWYVFCPVSDRKRRLMQSRGYTTEKIESILCEQCSEEEYRAIATAVITNSDETDESELLEQIERLINR